MNMLQNLQTQIWEYMPPCTVTMKGFLMCNIPRKTPQKISQREHQISFDIFNYQKIKRLDLPWYFSIDALYDYNEWEEILNYGYVMISKSKDKRVGWFYDRHLNKTWYENEVMIIEPYGKKVKSDIEMFKFYLEGFYTWKRLNQSEIKLLKDVQKSSLFPQLKKNIKDLLYQSDYLEMLREMHLRSLKDRNSEDDESISCY